MVKTNRHFGSLALAFAVLAACQAPQKPQDEAVSSQQPASTQVEASEGVVGPDEAFFAEYYLEQVFRYSAENGRPALESGAVLAVAPTAVSAFDFAANYSDSRLRLMVKSLFLQGDTDADGVLSGGEFQSLKLDPGLLGVNAERLSHGFDQTLFLRIAGEEELLQVDECSAFLRDVGPGVKRIVDRSSAQDQRRGLVKAWEKVLGRYDADQSGNLSLQEQRDLRRDRALLITRLIGE